MAKVEKVAKVPKISKVSKVSKVKTEGKNIFAVLRILGKQYLVKEGEEVLVDKVGDIKNVKCDVLLLINGEEVLIGKPVLEKVKVKFEVVAEVEKGEKIDVFKYKAKSRERRHVGFRPQYTRLLVEKILA